MEQEKEFNTWDFKSMASNGIANPKSKHEEIHPMLKAQILANPTFDSIGDSCQIYPELKDQILAERAFDYIETPSSGKRSQWRRD